MNNGCVIHIVLFVFLINFLICEVQCSIDDKGERKDVDPFGMYRNYTCLKRGYFIKYKGQRGVIAETSTTNIVTEFESRCSRPTRQLAPSTKKHPFIVFEDIIFGYTYRSYLTLYNYVRKKMGAKLIHNPPSYMDLYKPACMGDMYFRSIFFQLGNYGAACFANDFLKDVPVIISRYWLYQRVFSIAKSVDYEDLPPPSSNLYTWPEDLLKPDLIFYINLPIKNDSFVMLEDSKMLRKKMLYILRNWRTPKVVELNISSVPSELAFIAFNHIRSHLGIRYS